MKIGRLVNSLIVIILSVTIVYQVQNEIIVITRYTYTTDKIVQPFRVVHLTDLHSHMFGKNNQRLIKKIKCLNPDIILMTGDMLTKTDKSHSVILELAKEAVKIAPVYYSMGNHENEYCNYYDLISDLEGVGVTVLDDFWMDTSIKGNDIRIFGAYDYVGAHYSESVVRKLIEFCDTDNLKIVLSHVPSPFIYRDEDKWKYDLVFSGHFHGGQMRLPFIGGLRTPDGWFPEYDKGRYDKNDYTVFISAGLGSELTKPRINNPPEIMVVDVVPK